MRSSICSGLEHFCLYVEKSLISYFHFMTNVTFLCLIKAHIAVCPVRLNITICHILCKFFESYLWDIFVYIIHPWVYCSESESSSSEGKKSLVMIYFWHCYQIIHFWCTGTRTVVRWDISWCKCWQTLARELCTPYLLGISWTAS